MQRLRLEMKSIQNTRAQQFIEPLVLKADEAKDTRWESIKPIIVIIIIIGC